MSVLMTMMMSTAFDDSLMTTSIRKTPCSSGQPLYKPGWTAKVINAKLSAPEKDSTGRQITSYVKSVSWTANGVGIPSESYDTFTARAGAVPETRSVVLPARQTYSNGSTTDWPEIAEGGAVPEHPVPVLTVVPANGDSSSSRSGSPAPMPPPASASSIRGVGFGIGGLIAGGLGLIVAVVALVRINRNPAGDQ